VVHRPDGSLVLTRHLVDYYRLKKKIRILQREDTKTNISNFIASSPPFLTPPTFFQKHKTENKKTVTTGVRAVTDCFPFLSSYWNAFRWKLEWFHFSDKNLYH